MTKEKLLKNSRGEYNYQFNWVNEDGQVTGFNNVWATNKRDAVKLAKAMESPARDTEWGRMSGMYVDLKSMYKATAKQAAAMDRLGWMMTC
jgi:hypothetical protein